MKTKPSQRTSESMTAFRIIGGLCIAGLFLFYSVAQAATPPDPRAEMRFDEGPDDSGGDGVTTANIGVFSGTYTFDAGNDYARTNANNGTTNRPAFTTNVPTGTFVPAGNAFSVDMGPQGGLCADGVGGKAIDGVENMTANGADPFYEITVCAWVNAYKNDALRNEGYQIAYAEESQAGLGFAFACGNAGDLALTVNGGGVGPRSSVNMITADGGNAPDNWVFVAATYNPTLASNNLSYYFGRPDKLAALDSTFDYQGGDTFTNIIDFSGTLSVGNASTVAGIREDTGSCAPFFRGLIDELTIYTNALTLDEIQQAQLNAVVPPTPATFLQQPTDVATPEGLNPTWSVEANGSGLVTYQWKTNGVAVAGATNQTFTLSGVTLAEDGTTVSVLIDNDALADPGTESDIVTLTVVPAVPMIAYFPFYEGSGDTTANVGAFGGIADFRSGSGFPAWTNNVPVGAFAPSNNVSAINHGPSGSSSHAVELNSNLINANGSLSGMDGLTICGWINSANDTYRTTSSGRGTRIVSAITDGSSGESAAPGFVLGYRDNDVTTSAGFGNSGRLTLCVNAWDRDPLDVLTSVDTVPIGATNNATTNWVFFAVTYDGTTDTDNCKFYFGDGDTAATLDVTVSYPMGVIANTGPLSIGNRNPGSGDPSGRTVGGNNGTYWRGLFDEIRVFSEVRSLAQIQASQVTASPDAPPMSPIVMAITDNGDGTVTINWDRGELYTADSLTGTWTATGDTSGNLTEAAGDSEKYYSAVE